MTIYKKLPRGTQYYDIDARKKKDYFDIYQDEDVYIDGKQVQIGNGTSEDKYEVHLTYLDGELVLHREDGPAHIRSNNHLFAHKGINLTIEDMPVDDEMKLILVLKYGSDTDPSNPCYHVYIT